MPDAEKSHSNPYAAAPCSSVTRITRKDLAKYDPRDAGGPSSQFFAYLRPSLLFVGDLNNTPGSYLQMRLDGAIPLLRRIFLLEPYLLLGLNLGYNTTAYYGWNHFQFGLKASWQLSRLISIHGGISCSVALTALQQIDQGNEVWANVGLSVSY